MPRRKRMGPRVRLRTPEEHAERIGFLGAYYEDRCWGCGHRLGPDGRCPKCLGLNVETHEEDEEMPPETVIDPRAAREIAREAVANDAPPARCRECGYPLEAEGIPCGRCVARPTGRWPSPPEVTPPGRICGRCHRDRLDDSGRCPTCSRCRPRAPTPSQLLPRIKAAAPPPTGPEPPPTREETVSEPIDAEAPNGRCPDCGRPYGKYRRCYACNPTRKQDAPAPRAGSALKRMIRGEEPRKHFQASIPDPARAPAPRRVEPAGEVVVMEDAPPIYREIEALGKVAEAVRGLSPASIDRVFAFVRSGLGGP